MGGDLESGVEGPRPTLREAIQIDQQAAAEAARRKWWTRYDDLPGYARPTPREWRLWAGILERTYFWRDERYRDRYAHPAPENLTFDATLVDCVSGG